MKIAEELTIVSVYHDSYTKSLIELNENLARRMNPDASWVWLLGDNSPGSPEAEREFKRNIINERFRPFSASYVSDKPDPKRFTVYSRDYSINEVTHGKFHWAYDEADGLHRCIAQANTRFIAVLDSDFYIVRFNWIRQILDHMQNYNIAFFGAPYWPADYAKFRYFPSAPFCMFVDLEKIPKADLDFNARFHLMPNGGEVRINKPGLFPLLDIRLRKSLIGSSPDCGINIFEKYYRKPKFPAECLQPVYDPFRESGLSSRTGMIANYIFELILPDQLCYIPKKRGYFTNLGFASSGVYEVRSRGWQEHMWQDEPFGFHVRGMRQRKDRKLSEEQIISSIDEVLGRYPTR